MMKELGRHFGLMHEKMIGRRGGDGIYHLWGETKSNIIYRPASFLAC
jgi:hypothetical protein